MWGDLRVSTFRALLDLKRSSVKPNMLLGASGGDIIAEVRRGESRMKGGPWVPRGRGRGNQNVEAQGSWAGT